MLLEHNYEGNAYRNTYVSSSQIIKKLLRVCMCVHACVCLHVRARACVSVCVCWLTCGYVCFVICFDISNLQAICKQ